MKKLIEDIIKFRDDRGWKHHDTPSALAKSIIIEAAELLENYQWEDEKPNMENVKEELADVLIYSIAMASDLGLNPETIIREKLEKNAIKYPKTKK
jgi:NTP pyrophosphatase (non-canonical NTP hydrolase)